MSDSKDPERETTLLKSSTVAFSRKLAILTLIVYLHPACGKGGSWDGGPLPPSHPLIFTTSADPSLTTAAATVTLLGGGIELWSGTTTVSWTNNPAGTSGAGLTSVTGGLVPELFWNATVPLQMGTNIITVTADDPVNHNHLTDSITITRIIPTNWTPQASGTTNSLTDVRFTSSSTGWSVGASGTILATTNGGATWSSQTSGTTNDLSGVTFTDSLHGWAVGASGTILATTNGGGTWVPQSSGISTLLTSVSFINSSVGWVVGVSGILLATPDGGTTWTPQSVRSTTFLQTSAASLIDVTFLDASKGWGAGNNTFGGLILNTVDGGVTWSEQWSGSSTLSSVAFSDANNGWAVGASGLIVHTSNGGLNWISQSSGVLVGLNGVTFTDSQNGWAVGSGGIILGTQDGGAHWSVQVQGLAGSLGGISGSSSNDLWTVGSGGATFVTTTGGH